MISIVTVSYNSEKTIARAIESVLNQTYSNIEYTIVDGLSNDSTVEIASSYIDKFKERGLQYRIISERDAGIYDAMNKGIRMSSGEIIGLINSDDWYETNALERVASVYEAEKFELFYADLRIIKPSGNIIKKSKNNKWLTTKNWNHPTTFITKKTYERFSYKCESIYDDWDLILRIRHSGAKVVVLNEVLANFSFGGISNQKNWSKMRERVKLKYKIYRENGYPSIVWFNCFFMEFMKYILS